MIKKTKNYDEFIFRDDNRMKIDYGHVKVLIESIRFRNRLELKPIIVNKKMEIIDGQHRLLAAKELGVDIYYTIENDLTIEDVIIMNTAKSWLLSDFHNFYVKNRFPEYIKLNEFMKKNNLSLKVCLNLIGIRSKKSYSDYKQGKFVFKQDLNSEKLDICWDTINYIHYAKGHQDFTATNRFWSALIRLTNHEDFNREKWMKNLKVNIEKISVRPSTEDYIKSLLDIYNWRSGSKIDI